MCCIHRGIKSAQDWWSNSSQQVKSWTGYDGTPNIEEFTKGHVTLLDLSQPQNLSKADWVMSLEVGQHIPKELESTYLSNILEPVKEGLVLSWAVHGQGGRIKHFNELNNTQVEEKMAARGYYLDKTLRDNLREKAASYWFKKSLMVFRPNATVQ